jgi:hypothetical protein
MKSAQCNPVKFVGSVSRPLRDREPPRVSHFPNATTCFQRRPKSMALEYLHRENATLPSNMQPGAQYRLRGNLTALQRTDEGPSLVKLSPGIVVSVAAIIQGSRFVEVSCEGTIYEVVAEDLLEAAEPHSGLEL